MSQRGSIHRRGDSWTVRWRTDTADGRKHHSKGIPYKKDAQDFLTDVIATIHGGVFAEPNKVTVGDFLIERWLPARKLSLRPSTYASYQTAINRHVIPEARARPDPTALTLTGSTASTPSSWPAVSHPRPCGTSTSCCARRARRRPQEPRTPQRGRRRRPAQAPPREPGRDEDLDAGAAACVLRRHRRPSARAAYLLRRDHRDAPGRGLGVRWRDIDFKARRLHVRQTILSVNYQLTLGQPKTLRGERKIALDAETTRVLEAHRANQRHERRLLGAGYHGQDLVFAHEDGSPIHPDYFSQTFDRAVKRLELPEFRLHDLRQSHATLGLGAGVPIKVMSDRLGHATTSFTMDIYMHAIPAIEDDAADQIAGLMFGNSEATQELVEGDNEDAVVVNPWLGVDDPGSA